MEVQAQRGPEELLSPLSNGTAMSPQPVSLDGDAKKAKLDAAALVSASAPNVVPVLAVPNPAGAPNPALLHHSLAHLQAHPMAALSGAVLNAAPIPASSAPGATPNVSIPNGPINSIPGASGRSRVVHLRNVPGDMSDVELLHLCIPFGKVTNFLLLKGKNQAFVEYEDETGAVQLVNVSTSCPIALRGRTIFCQFSNHQELKTDNKNAFNVPAAQGGSGSGAMGTETGNLGTQQAPNSVLRVIIENMLYPVTLDILHQIFSRFGKVLRIITFSKNNTFQALVQYSEAQSAQVARTALDGQNVYNGCCTLRIDYSKLATLNVKYNNDKSRDYTNPNLPSGELTLEHPLAIAGMLAANGGNALGGLNALALSNPLAFAGLPGGPGLPGPPPGQPAPAGTEWSAFSSVPGGLGANPAAAMAGLGLPAFSVAGTPGGGGSVVASPTLRTLPAHLAALTMPPVILVSNLHEDKVTCDALFTLFGVYGDVQRVKILFNKKDNALIQYAEPAQAQIAIQHLDKVKLWGKQIRVAASKHNNVQMPKEGQPDAGLTKDYSQSPLHRFKKPGSKNYLNIYPPSATLHLSNIPPNITQDFLAEAFAKNHFQVKAFKFFPKDHKMALVQLGSVEEAILALIHLHNHKLAENAHLRVSFSKSGI